MSAGPHLVGISDPLVLQYVGCSLVCLVVNCSGDNALKPISRIIHRVRFTCTAVSVTQELQSHFPIAVKRILEKQLLQLDLL